MSEELRPMTYEEYELLEFGLSRLAKKDAEIKRLREALYNISASNDTCDTTGKEIARKALRGTP